MTDGPRFWALDALEDEDTSQHNRINEAREAIGFPVVGIVDEQAGGVIAYVNSEYVEKFVEALNREEAE